MGDPGRETPRQPSVPGPALYAFGWRLNRLPGSLLVVPTYLFYRGTQLGVPAVILPGIWGRDLIA
jgi:hypothetical protein